MKCCEEWKRFVDKGGIYEGVGGGWYLRPASGCTGVQIQSCPWCGSPAGEEPKPSALEEAVRSVALPTFCGGWDIHLYRDRVLALIREHAKRPSREEVEAMLDHGGLRSPNGLMAMGTVLDKLEAGGVFGPEKRPRCGNPLGPNGLKCDLPEGHMEWHKSDRHEQRWQRGM